MFAVWSGAKKFLVATFVDGAGNVAFFGEVVASWLECRLRTSLKSSPCCLLAFSTPFSSFSVTISAIQCAE
jgi:hypothetical protein